MIEIFKQKSENVEIISYICKREMTKRRVLMHTKYYPAEV